MKYLKKFFKILLKNFITIILLIYLPLPFSNIFSFFNELDNNIENYEYNWKDKLKIAVIGFVLIGIFYIVLKNGNGIAPDSVSSNTKSVNSTQIQQEKIMKVRLDNALSLTQRILEIKKNKA